MLSTIYTQLEILNTKAHQLDVIEAKINQLNVSLSHNKNQVLARIDTLEYNIKNPIKCYITIRSLIMDILPQCLQDCEFRVGYGKRFWDGFDSLTKLSDKGEVNFLEYCLTKLSINYQHLEDVKMLAMMCVDEINADSQLKQALNKIRVDYNIWLVEQS